MAERGAMADGRRANSRGLSASEPESIRDGASAAEPGELSLGSAAIAQLQQIAALHASGALTDSEFEATKAGLLS